MSKSGAVERRVVLIAGPTASGKSALALDKAAELDGVIVNADSMQVYNVLNVLTARPDGDDLRKAPHHLYGFVPPSVRFSTGAWVEAVKRLLARQDVAERSLFFVGGTGLYFLALIKGFSAMPAVPDEIVQRWNAEIEGLDRAGRGALLNRLDPLMGQQLSEPDPQRVVRALSVLEATGRSLAEWQADTEGSLLAGAELERIVLDPDRGLLRRRIAERFDWMLDHGAVEEVQALLALGLAEDLPAMKAIGVPQIREWLAGRISRDEVIELSVNATRQYSKRQRTWFRKQMADWEWRG